MHCMFDVNLKRIPQNSITTCLRRKEDDYMTICIGVVCQNRKRAIFASDRMLTSSGLSVEFEHNEPKYETLSSTCVGLSAGEAMPVTELFDEVRKTVASKASPTIKEIADLVSESLRKCKMKLIEEKYFKPRGLTIASYLQAQRHLNENVVLRLERAIEGERLRMINIVVGVDNYGAHIYEVTDPGHSECYQRLGFHAIGSDLPHAISTFISHDFTPSMDLRKALFVTYEAKKNAENAPGVGTATDIGFITEAEIKILSENELNTLDKIYTEKKRVFSESTSSIENMINELPFGQKKK
jgi:hypothetical protein